MRQYNIGVDARKLGPTGIGRYTAELVAAMAQQHPEHIFHLMVMPDYQQAYWRVLSSLTNITVHITTAGYYSVAEQLRYGAEIDALGLDLIHFPNFNTPRRVKTPMVVTVQDLTLLSYAGRTMWFGKRQLYQLVLNHTLRQANAIIVGSKDTKTDVDRYMRKLGRVPKSREITVVPHGVSEIFQQRLTKAELTAGLRDLSIVNPYLLVVGAQLVHKNVHGVLSAFAALVTQNPDLPHKLVIAGNRTVPAPHLEELLQQPALRDRVVWVGAIDDAQLRTLYRGAVALVFPSFKEGFGLPVLEAFASGCPVITSKRSSLPEVGGPAAWYIDPANTNELVTAMRRVIRRPDSVARKVAIGKRRVEQFQWSKAATTTWEVYEQVIRPS